MSYSNDNWEYLESFFMDSFIDGQGSRELRLSQEELHYLKLRYPSAEFRVLDEYGISNLNKQWYLVTFYNQR